MARSVDYATGRAYFYFKAFFKRDPYKLPAEPRKPLKRQISIKICIMKTIATNYKLTTNGKKLRVNLVALFRAVGIGGDVSEAEVPGDVLDTLRVQLVRPNVTGAETLTNDPNARCYYSLDGSNLDVSLAGLAGGVHRLTVLVGYGTNSAALLIADLEAPDNVLYLVAPGDVRMPLERYPDKDVEADGVAYYAYRYAYGNKLAWLMTDKPQHLRGTVEAYYVADMTASLEDATELEGARLIMNYDLDIYDSSELVALSPVDTFGSVGGGGGSNENVTVLLTLPEGAAAVDWTQYHVSVEYLSQGRTEDLTLNAQGKCTFTVPAGEQYMVVFPHLEGYAEPIAEHFTAVGGDKTVHYAYRTNERVEKITVLAKNDAGLDISALIGQEVTLTTESGFTTSAVFGSNYKAELEVEYGEVYAVHVPTIEGWHPHKSTFSGTADRAERYYIVHYIPAGAGAFGIDANGTHYTEEEISNLEDKTIIKYIGYTDSELEAAPRGDGSVGCGFMFEIPVAATGKAWATSNVQFDTSLLPNLNSTQAKTDFKGLHNTELMRDIAEDLGISSPAADYALAYKATVGGQEFTSFVPGAGTWQKIMDNWTVINAISIAAGRGTLPFKSGTWWSSSQYSASGAWYLLSGSLTVYNGKGSGYSVARFFDLYA